MDTLTSLIRERNVTLTVTGDAKKSDPGWGHPVNAYRVRLQYDGRHMDLDFYQGLGIQDQPDVAGVLSCLLSDASSIEGTEDIMDWAVEYGFPLNDRDEINAARKTYRATVRSTDRLRRLLGEDFDLFMYADNNV